MKFLGFLFWFFYAKLSVFPTNLNEVKSTLPPSNSMRMQHARANEISYFLFAQNLSVRMIHCLQRYLSRARECSEGKYRCSQGTLNLTSPVSYPYFGDLSEFQDQFLCRNLFPSSISSPTRLICHLSVRNLWKAANS